MTDPAAELCDELFGRFSDIGRKDETGVERLAFGRADAEVRAQFRDECHRHGLHFHVDQIGNQFGLVKAPEEGQKIVLVGSHLDSQPAGGRFDGQLGVAAGLAVVAIERAKGSLPVGCNLGTVNWANEEGARFQPSVMGSSVFTGQLALETALNARDAQNVLLADELEAKCLAGTSMLPGQLAAYAELHVEQGSELEEHDLNIGVVERTWAAYKADIRVRGQQTHTGPTPMAKRIDALAAAARLIVLVRELGLRDYNAQLHTAIAWMRITPNSPNATPSLVELKVELRSPDESLLDATRARLSAEVTSLEDEMGVQCELNDWSERRASRFCPEIVAGVEAAISTLGLSVKRVATIAGHDAVVTNAAGAPTTLLFVPSAGGITHNAAEFTSVEDRHRGVTALAVAVKHLLERIETDSPH
ncbi:Zn-dependent hydrolase [Leucobacter insecticola]|uniref:Zn-dependent hydrolase n=1 Tax=Leucobacter insecticola TaxID=2714934 RepID=A0A6G8FL71_9MICO|nr:Zn-dependent hydrolase [Leucobacter insecticola]QIM17101.1 Zn-dependent hydrolase [Leucobacter insecticola]